MEGLATVTGGGAGAAIRLSGITKTFDGVPVLRDVACTITPGSVHALLGGNGSGKSTLLKILAGVHQADQGGTITIHGRAHATGSYGPAIARRSGLRFVHQDLGLVPDLTVSENFALEGGYPRRAGMAISWRELRRSAGEILERAHVDVDPQRLVRDLRPSDRTLVAIARALRDGDENGGEHVTLVLDEPTASLSQHEAGVLLDAIRRCRSRGQTIVYVSHRLPEVLEIADRIAVLRDGVLVAEQSAADLDESAIVTLMTGEEMRRQTLGAGPAADAETVLTVDALAAGPLREVSLSVRRHEIVGIAGLLGSGRSTLLRTLFGQANPDRGGFEVDGVPARFRSPRDAIRRGVALVPEDRGRDAAFADLPLWENVSATVIGRYWSGWRMARASERRDAVHLIETFGIRSATADAPFAHLSGGNQQKAVLARWLRLDPRLLLLDEPTQGVDAPARADIHDLVRRHVARGNAALVVSSDFEELETLCHRVIVLRDGAQVAELHGPRLTEAAIAGLTQTARKEAAHD
ncbi:sugar ABC transporter ATP-binding protein [Spongiactinospora sp. TRM90649]|uniref:sugar ABC transporter ATP-binding protein n=1 Tax=Spongiactinospora sp. TRM90649 TaxID=3031114 RepID=UPI0023F8825B|nr:sugar ABC transporter ATP-binding protein [Spongiactinospora sp. TRM90649]MDF5755124.1 sugar ABC transporter ATP-binding protein [Spongiactinospora sp. TRM90649]